MKPRISQLGQSGATNGQTIRWNNSTGQWELATLPAKASDLTTVILPLTTLSGSDGAFVFTTTGDLILSEVPYP